MRVRRTSAMIVFAVLVVLALLWMTTSRRAGMSSPAYPDVTTGAASAALPQPTPVDAAGAPPREPASGSPERAAIVEAVRRDVGNTTRYRIDHLRATPRWAFFSGTEIVPLDGGEDQETDLSVQALLEQRTADGAPRWEVVERWTLPTNDSAPHARFLQRLRDRIARDAVPKALFPPDLFK